MVEIVSKKNFNSDLFEITLKAPLVAAKARPGQFCILIADEKGERTPFTLADWDKEAGTISLVIQVSGKTSRFLAEQNLKTLPHLTGPLGSPSHIDSSKKHVVFTGGGLGVAALYPILRAYHSAGVHTTTILGFRHKELLFWKEKFEQFSHQLIIATEDGSIGMKGRVTAPLAKLLNESAVDEVYAIGPLPMMQAVSELTRPYLIRTIVSLNPIMVDGMGMCGACRVTVDGVTRYACIEGPEFDGHLVNFTELMARNKQFAGAEEVCLSQYFKGMKPHA